MVYDELAYDIKIDNVIFEAIEKYDPENFISTAYSMAIDEAGIYIPIEIRLNTYIPDLKLLNGKHDERELFFLIYPNRNPMALLNKYQKEIIFAKLYSPLDVSIRVAPSRDITIGIFQIYSHIGDYTLTRIERNGTRIHSVRKSTLYRYLLSVLDMREYPNPQEDYNAETHKIANIVDTIICDHFSDEEMKEHIITRNQINYSNDEFHMENNLRPKHSFIGYVGDGFIPNININSLEYINAENQVRNLVMAILLADKLGMISCVKILRLALCCMSVYDLALYRLPMAKYGIDPIFINKYQKTIKKINNLAQAFAEEIIY